MFGCCRQAGDSSDVTLAFKYAQVIPNVLRKKIEYTDDTDDTDENYVENYDENYQLKLKEFGADGLCLVNLF